MRELYYNEKKCDGCAEIMHDDEDIVVCPECGTPQHRECYNKNHACVNAHLHAEGFDWLEANPEKAPEPTPEQPQDQRPVKIEILKADENTDLHGEIPDFPLPLFSVDATLMDGQGLKPDDEFDGIKVSDALSYTQISAGRYLKKFIKNKGKKHLVSWNWGAFIFGPAWFFYRKIYNVGAFFLALVIAATLIVTPFANVVSDNFESYNAAFTSYKNSFSDYLKEDTPENEAALDKAAEAAKAELMKVAPAVSAFYLFTFILPNTVAALIADSVYRKKMFEDIRIAKKATSDPKVMKYSLLRRGGVSLFAALAALMAKSYMPSLILSVISRFI